ncbi:MAG: DUF5719 family protein [Iamia sp.]
MTRRWPALVLILALLVGGALVGRDGATDAEEPAVDASTLLPVAAPADALGSVWFCAGQTAGDDTDADGTLVIANPSEDPAAGQVEAVSADGETASQGIEVAPWTTTRLRVADLLEAEWAAARIETTSGTVAVDHEVVGPEGRDAAPCQTRAGDRWLLPAGASTRDARLTLLVYNPYPGAATVDMSFTTPEGVRRPSDLQGIPVPAESVVPVNVSDVVTIRPVISTTVTARRGRVVVDRIQTYDGRGAATTEEEAAQELFKREGLTLTPAVARAGTRWSFAAGLRGQGIHEQITLFNPTDEVAEVDITLALEDPERNGVLDPFPMEVGPGGTEVFDVDGAEAVPEGVTHSVDVQSTNGVPVVAERALSVTDPASYRAELTSTGSPVAAAQWVFPAGRASLTGQLDRIAVTNPGDEGVEISVRAFGDGALSEPLGEGPSVLGPGESREVDLDELNGLDGDDEAGEDQRSLQVEATGPITAERRIIAGRAEPEDGEDEGAPGTGGSVTTGIPVGPRFVILEP